MNNLEPFLQDKNLKMNRFYDADIQLINENKYIFGLKSGQILSLVGQVPFELRFLMG
jgi:hypothetical protein